MLEHMSWKISTSRTNGRIFIQIWSVLIELKVAANNFPPPSVSKWCYCCCHCCKDNQIASVYLRVANKNNIGQNCSLFNHLVYSRNGSTVNPFPGRPGGRRKCIVIERFIVNHCNHCSISLFFIHYISKSTFTSEAENLLPVKKNNSQRLLKPCVTYSERQDLMP